LGKSRLFKQAGEMGTYTYGPGFVIIRLNLLQPLSLPSEFGDLKTRTQIITAFQITPARR